MHAGKVLKPRSLGHQRRNQLVGDFATAPARGITTTQIARGRLLSISRSPTGLSARPQAPPKTKLFLSSNRHRSYTPCGDGIPSPSSLARAFRAGHSGPPRVRPIQLNMLPAAGETPSGMGTCKCHHATPLQGTFAIKRRVCLWARRRATRQFLPTANTSTAELRGPGVS